MHRIKNPTHQRIHSELGEPSRHASAQALLQSGQQHGLLLIRAIVITIAARGCCRVRHAKLLERLVEREVQPHVRCDAKHCRRQPRVETCVLRIHKDWRR